MAAESFTVDINPAVLRWARESAGYSVSQAANLCRVPEDAVAGWESGNPQPTWSEVSRLARVYKRPVSALLLLKPPEETPAPTDYRTLPTAKKDLSPKTRLAIRTARWLVRRACELERELGVTDGFRALTASLADDPEGVADQFRQRLGVAISGQTAWRSVGEAMRRWRAAAEAQHVFVFQFRMPVVEVRGFSLVEEDRQAIVLNAADAVSARIFTLFHEYAHLLIARPGLCIPEEGQPQEPKPVEVFCNRVAASFLVPLADLEARLPRVPTDEVIAELAIRYRVSRYVVLGRMRTLGAVSEKVYQQTRRRWDTQAAAGSDSRRKRKGGKTRAELCLEARGRRFVSVVLEATDRGFIPASDATSYLGIRLGDYGNLASKVK